MKKRLYGFFVGTILALSVGTPIFAAEAAEVGEEARWRVEPGEPEKPAGEQAAEQQSAWDRIKKGVGDRLLSRARSFLSGSSSSGDSSVNTSSGSSLSLSGQSGEGDPTISRPVNPDPIDLKNRPVISPEMMDAARDAAEGQKKKKGYLARAREAVSKGLDLVKTRVIGSRGVAPEVNDVKADLQRSDASSHLLRDEQREQSEGQAAEVATRQAAPTPPPLLSQTATIEDIREDFASKPGVLGLIDRVGDAEAKRLYDMSRARHISSTEAADAEFSKLLRDKVADSLTAGQVDEESSLFDDGKALVPTAADFFKSMLLEAESKSLTEQERKAVAQDVEFLKSLLKEKVIDVADLNKMRADLRKDSDVYDRMVELRVRAYAFANQHVEQAENMESLLKALKVRFDVLPEDKTGNALLELLQKAVHDGKTSFAELKEHFKESVAKEDAQALKIQPFNLEVADKLISQDRLVSFVRMSHFDDFDAEEDSVEKAIEEASAQQRASGSLPVESHVPVAPPPPPAREGAGSPPVAPPPPPPAPPAPERRVAPIVAASGRGGDAFAEALRKRAEGLRKTDGPQSSGSEENHLDKIRQAAEARRRRAAELEQKSKKPLEIKKEDYKEKIRTSSLLQRRADVVHGADDEVEATTVIEKVLDKYGNKYTPEEIAEALKRHNPRIEKNLQSELEEDDDVDDEDENVSLVQYIEDEIAHRKEQAEAEKQRRRQEEQERKRREKAEAEKQEAERKSRLEEARKKREESMTPEKRERMRKAQERLARVRAEAGRGGRDQLLSAIRSRGRSGTGEADSVQDTDTQSAARRRSGRSDMIKRMQAKLAESRGVPGESEQASGVQPVVSADAPPPPARSGSVSAPPPAPPLPSSTVVREGRVVGVSSSGGGVAESKVVGSSTSNSLSATLDRMMLNAPRRGEVDEDDGDDSDWEDDDD